MKIITFIDLENFRHSLWKSNSSREPKYDSLHRICEKIIEKLGWEKYNPRHVRTYVYTGEYTDNLISQIKHLSSRLTKDWQKKRLEDSLKKATNRKESQQKLFEYMNNCNFFELKTTPIKFNVNMPKPFFQKGVDVLIATDLLSHAYQGNFDAAIICSGDLDLLEAIKLTKNLGKKIIIVSHRDEKDSGISKNLVKASDYFVNISEFSENELNEISDIIKNNTQA